MPEIEPAVIIEEIKACVLAEISREHLTIEPEIVLKDVGSKIGLALTAVVLGERLAEQKVQVSLANSFYFPTSPWQFFKQRHPRLFWRWPVKEEPHRKEVKRTVHTVQFATFPASPIKLPEKDRGPIVGRYERTEVYGS